MHQDETGNSPSGWAGVIGPLFEGGLPQFIAGPAGKAISRLIGGAADIPAAYLEQLSQAVRDRTRARSIIVTKVAEASASAASSDQDVLDRAISHYAGELHRSQLNREAIAAQTLEHLRRDPPPLDTPGPEDDWLNSFQRNASEASSERMQDLYARILAGEIRQPGSFSLTTLRFMNVLDSHTAAAINAVLPLVIDGHWMIRDLAHVHLKLNAILDLDEAGFLYSGGGNLNKTLMPVLDGKAVLGFGETALITPIFTSFGKVGSYNLTRAGRELYRLLTPEPALDHIAVYLKSLGAENLFKGRAEIQSDGRRLIVDLMPYG